MESSNENSSSGVSPISQSGHFASPAQRRKAVKLIRAELLKKFTAMSKSFAEQEAQRFELEVFLTTPKENDYYQQVGRVLINTEHFFGDLYFQRENSVLSGRVAEVIQVESEDGDNMECARIETNKYPEGNIASTEEQKGEVVNVQRNLELDNVSSKASWNH